MPPRASVPENDLAQELQYLPATAELCVIANAMHEGMARHGGEMRKLVDMPDNNESMASRGGDGCNQSPDNQSASSSSRIAQGSAAGVVAQILYLTTRFLLTPFVLAHIGLEAYGFWSILFVALGWFGLHRMGFTSAAVSYVAQYRAAGDSGRINAVLTTTATFGLGLAVIVGGLLVGFAPYMALALGTTDALHTQAVLALRITVLATFGSLVFGGYQSSLEALQEYPRVKLIDATALLVEAGAIIGFLIYGGGLVELSIAYAIRMLGPIPVYAIFARRKIPGLNALPVAFDRSVAREIFRFGGSIQALGILHLIITSIERLALAHLVSLAAAGAYELGRKLVALAAALPTHALAPLVPAAADLRGRATSKTVILTDLLRTSTRAVSIVAAAPLAVFIVIGPSVVYGWLGESHAEVEWTLRVLSISAYIHLSTGPSTAVLRGLAQPRLELIYTAAWLALGAVLIPAAAMYQGIIGAAAAAATAQGAASLLLLAMALPRLGLSRLTLLRDMGMPAVNALLPALAAVTLFGASAATDGRLESIILVIGVGAIVTIISVVLDYRYVLEQRERNVLDTFLRRLLDRRLSFAHTEVSPT